MEQEQGSDRITGAVHRDGQAGRAQEVEPTVLRDQQIHVIAGRQLGFEAGQQHAPQPVRTHGAGKALGGLLGASQRAAVDTGQTFQFEPIGGGDIRLRQGVVAQELLDALPHVDAFLQVADHRIAAVDRSRVLLAHPRDRVQDGFADAGIPHVAGQHGVAVPKHIAGGDAVHQLTDGIAGVDLPGPVAIPGVIGELHRVDRPDLGTQALQRENRAGIADMAISHPGLDREDVHTG